MRNIDMEQEFDVIIFEIWAKLQTLQNKNRNNPDSDNFKVNVLINNYAEKALVRLKQKSTP